MGEHGGRPLLEASAEVLLDACFAAAPVGFGVVDEDLRWVRANRVLAALNGAPARDHVGRTLAEVGGAFAGEVEPLLRRALEGQAAVDVRVRAGADDSVRVSCFPLGDDAGARGAGLVVVEGGTEPRARLSLRLSEERLRLALEGTQTGTWEWERDTDAISWSASVGPLFGLERGSAPPGFDEYMAMVHPDDREALAAAVRESVEQGTGYEREFRALRPDGSYRWLSSRAHALRDDDGDGDGAALFLVGLITDIHERRERELSAEFLSQASMLLSGSLELETTLQQLADLTVPVLADWCEVELAGSGERFRSTAAAELEPAAPHTLVVPLRAGERAVGAIRFARAGRAYGEGEIALAEELARRAGLVIDNAVLHRSEREALQRLEQLQTISDVGLSHLDLDDLLRELLRRITQLTESPDAAVLLVDENVRSLRVAAAVGLTEAARDEIEVPIGAGVEGGIAARGESRLIDDLQQVQVYTDFLRRSARSLIGAPLLDGEEVIGVLRVTSPNPRAFTPADLELLELVADRAARAISHARLYEQARGTALTLQRALLPGAMPSPPGLRIASRYLPGQGGLEVGGDWYDVFEAADGRIVLVVGDIVGRGVRAAAVMAQLRNALRAYAFEDPEPAAVLGRLDALVDRGIIEVEFATAFVGVLEPARRRLTASSAGHPPGLVVAGGAVEILSDVAGVPLGAGRPERRQGTRELAAGSVLLLYTDGLIERRTVSPAAGIEAVARAVAVAGPEPEAVLDAALAAAPWADAGGDDVALLAAHLA